MWSRRDSLIGSLTVKETVEFSAKFANIPKRFRGDLVDGIISLRFRESKKFENWNTLTERDFGWSKEKNKHCISSIKQTTNIIFG